MQWRRKWRHNWEAVRYCSRACRQKGLNPTDRRLETLIIEMLQARGAGNTICPSEAARIMAGKDAPQKWRALRPAARKAARRLVAQGKAEILQRGRPVDASTVRGAFRIRLRSGH